MTKKRAVAIIFAVVMLISVFAAFAACVEKPLGITDMVNYLNDISSGVAVPGVSVTVTENATQTVIYSYPTPAEDVPDEIAGVIDVMLPDLNGTSTFNYDLNLLTLGQVTEEGSIATLTAEIADMNAFMGTSGLNYSNAHFTATADTVAQRITGVELTYTFNNSFTIAVNTVYNY